MNAFVMLAAVLLILVTACLLWPLLARRVAGPNTAAESPALAILREQRKDLQADLAAGRISREAYEQTLAEIERRALEEAAMPEAAVQRGARPAWAVAVGVGVPLVTIALYLAMGTPAGLDPANLVAHQGQQVTPADIDAMVARVAERVKANPDDLQALQMLGRSYMVLNRFPEAAEAFAQLAKKQPDDAQVYADWADAAASAQDRKLDGEPEKLIARALSLDPNNLKALALSGTVAFERKDYKGALRQWERIAAQVPADSEFGQSVQGMIAEARARAGMPAAAEAAPAAPAGPRLSLKGRVTLAESLRDKLGAEDVLFVFARPAAGGPPIAGMRFPASQLPVEFDFAKAQMMMGSAGPNDELIVGARISKRGNAMPASGDLQGFSGKVTAAAGKPVQIEINEQVK